MDRERLAKLVAAGIEYGLLATWLLTVFFWVPSLPDLAKLLWVPFLIGIIFLSIPLKILEYWIAGHPDPREKAAGYWRGIKAKVEDDPPFGG